MSHGLKFHDRVFRLAARLAPRRLLYWCAVRAAEFVSGDRPSVETRRHLRDLKDWKASL